MRWSTAIRRALGPGSLAAVLSSAALIVFSGKSLRAGLAAHSGPSQWIHGRSAGYRRRLDIKHTVTGYLIHHASSWMWATIDQQLWKHRHRSAGAVLVQGLAVAAMACFVDYRLTPARFQPGFEKHLPKRSLAAVYVLFGVGLGLGRYLQSRRR